LNLAAVLGPPQHRRIHLLQCLMQGMQGGDLPDRQLATGLTSACCTRPCQWQDHLHNCAFALTCWLDRHWTEEGACVKVGETAREPKTKPKPSATRNPAIKCSDCRRSSWVQSGLHLGYSITNLVSRCPASNLQPSLGSHPVTSLQSRLCECGEMGPRDAWSAARQPRQR
jgi:hypothetical protein